MLLHETGRLLHWLEGPRESIAALWRSIKADPRFPGALTLLERGPDRAVNDAIAELARLAVAGDTAGLNAAIATQLTLGKNLRSLCSELIEPACRLLGDGWSEDRYGDFDVTLALCSLQIALRVLCAMQASMSEPTNSTARRVLIVPQPGEAHSLGGMLAGELFRDSGWIVQTEFPRANDELVETARQAWFDVVCLSLSNVYERRDRLEAVAETVRDLRLGSQNFAITIMVGGRVFRDHPEITAARIGADSVYTSVSDAVDRAELLLSARFDAQSEDPFIRDVPDLPAPLPAGWLWLHRNTH